MALSPQEWRRPRSASANSEAVQRPAWDSPVVPPVNAWRIICRRTGGSISRATFYRWLASGRVFSIRLGHRIYIPLAEVENVVKLCRCGERI
jgi:hypothetical protein